MAEETTRRRSLLVPALIGVLVGAIVGAAGAGVPLFMKARALEAQSAALTNANGALLAERDSARLAVANAEQQLQAERNSAQLAMTSAEQQLAQQRALTEELAKPALPLQLGVRKGWVDAGFVLTIRNVATDVAVMAKFESPGGGAAQKRIVIPANGIREIGETEGWAFSSRDSITLTSAGYQDMVYMVPVY